MRKKKEKKPKRTKEKADSGAADAKKREKAERKRERADKKRERAEKKRSKSPRGDGVAVMPRKMNVYEVMLVIAFVCIAMACMFLWFELGSYGRFPWWNTQ